MAAACSLSQAGERATETVSVTTSAYEGSVAGNSDIKSLSVNPEVIQAPTRHGVTSSTAKSVQNRPVVTVVEVEPTVAFDRESVADNREVQQYNETNAYMIKPGMVSGMTGIL